MDADHVERARTQGSFSSTTYHAMYTFLITTLLTLLQVHYQNKDMSPFATHLTAIGTFVVALCIYSSIVVAKDYGANCSKMLGHVSLVAGLLSLISLAVLFLPSSISSLIMFIMWAFSFVIVVALCFYQNIYQWFYPKIAAVVGQVQTIYQWFYPKIAAAVGQVQTIYEWFYNKTAAVAVQVRELYTSFVGQRSMDEQRLPV